MPGLEQFLVNVSHCARSYVTDDRGTNHYMREQSQAEAIRASDGPDTNRWRVHIHTTECGNKRPHSLVRYDLLPDVFLCLATNLT